MRTLLALLLSIIALNAHADDRCAERLDRAKNGLLHVGEDITILRGSLKPGKAYQYARDLEVTVSVAWRDAQNAEDIIYLRDELPAASNERDFAARRMTEISRDMEWLTSWNASPHDKQLAKLASSLRERLNALANVIGDCAQPDEMNHSK